ncbi:unnamed protein product, partial [Urochloa humidicola]
GATSVDLPLRPSQQRRDSPTHLHVESRRQLLPGKGQARNDQGPALVVPLSSGGRLVEAAAASGGSGGADGAGRGGDGGHAYGTPCSWTLSDPCASP